MGDALIHALPYALVNAASPTIPVVALALMALPGRGRRALVAYLVGCTATLVVLTVLVMTVCSQADIRKMTPRALPDWADLVIGGVLVVTGLWLWRRGPRPAGAPTRSVDGRGGLAIVFVGIYMELINLFTPPAYLVAVMTTAQEDLSPGERVVVVVLAALVVLAPVWLLIVISLVAPTRTDEVVVGIRRFFHRYGHRILVVVFLVTGVFLMGRSAWSMLSI